MLLLVSTVMFYIVTGVFSFDNPSSCKWEWVCPANNEYLKYKHLTTQRRASTFKYTSPVISVPKAYVSDSNNEIGVFKESTFPEVSLRLPEFAVEPVEVTCKSTEFARNVRNLRKKIKCTPRFVLVDVVSDEGKVIPNKVATKLCAGMCTGEKSCVSIKSVNISLSVRVEKENGEIKCTTISVPQDVKCKCGCDENKSKDCAPSQTYMKRICKCQCTNERDYYQCVNLSQASGKHKWDPDKCSCLCKHVRPCTTGTYWDHNECRCKI